MRRSRGSEAISCTDHHEKFDPNQLLRCAYGGDAIPTSTTPPCARRRCSSASVGCFITIATAPRAQPQVVGPTDGNYAQISAVRHRSRLVDFDLLKMHPPRDGMGAPGSAPPDLDQFIATTVAYGHTGGLADAGPCFNMHQPIQRATMVPVTASIRGGWRMPTSRRGRHAARSVQAHENGFRCMNETRSRWGGCRAGDS